MEDRIEIAKSSIGSDALDDYLITPTKFPNILSESAPELSEVLRHSNFIEKARRYETHDALALSSQEKFKGYAHQATWAICFAAISGSLIAAFAAANFAPSDYLTSAIFILGSISAVGGSIGVYRLHQIKSDKLLERWMTSRARAETERLGYFNAISRYIIKNHQFNIDLHLQIICMFRRYHLEVQRLYYETRSKDHRASLEKTSKIGAAAAFSLALGSGVLGMSGAFFPEFLPFAALGTIGAAITAVASRKEELNQDERNAERYSRTADILSKLAERYDDVLLIINEGNNPAIIVEFVDAVNDQLSLEHRQWTSDSSEMSSALNALEKSISALNEGG